MKKTLIIVLVVIIIVAGGILYFYRDAAKNVYNNTQQEVSEDTALYLHCEAEHIDGSMNASEKDTKLSWLKADIPEDTCRILSNDSLQDQYLDH
ncbi:MAG: hypothetical protein NT085_04705 [candidate division SR1 bacterium]|nr:hypothetical protein [candidate division SR1 bacterium]